MRILFAVFSVLLIFSNQANAALTERQKNQNKGKDKISMQQCATLRVDDKVVATPEVVAQCTVFFEGFANMLIEGIGSSPLANCRLISDGTARLKTNPSVRLDKWEIIAIHTDPPILAKDSKLSYLFFPWRDEYKNCDDWRVGARNALVVNPVPPKQ